MWKRIAAHLRLIWLFSRRCLLYNFALSLLGASALFAIILATVEGGLVLPETVTRAVRIAALMGAILVMSAGQALGLVAMRLFHGRELPYYRNAGLGEGLLAIGSWALALVVGAALLATGMAWT